MGPKLALKVSHTLMSFDSLVSAVLSLSLELLRDDWSMIARAENLAMIDLKMSDLTGPHLSPSTEAQTNVVLSVFLRYFYFRSPSPRCLMTFHRAYLPLCCPTFREQAWLFQSHSPTTAVWIEIAYQYWRFCRTSDTGFAGLHTCKKENSWTRFRTCFILITPTSPVLTRPKN